MLYPAIYLQPRCPSRHFGRNLLTPVLISLSPLAPGHPNDLHISTGNGPPSRFRETSSCPGLDRLVSGPTAMTPGTFTPRPSYTRRCIADLLLSLWLQALTFNLAITIDSPPRFSTRTTRPWSSPLVHMPYDIILRRDSNPFRPCQTITI